MINVKVKKGIIIGIIFLFLGSTIGPSISGNAGEPDRFVTSVIEYSGGSTDNVLGGPCGRGAYQGSYHVVPLGVSGSMTVAFDLDDLSNDPFVQSGDVDLQNINYVRMIDILGDGLCLDSQGNPIYDSTGPGNNGADIDSVAVINRRRSMVIDKIEMCD